MVMPLEPTGTPALVQPSIAVAPAQLAVPATAPPPVTPPAVASGRSARLSVPALPVAGTPAARLPRAELVDDPIGDPPDGVSAWNIANALTVLRLLLVPVFLVALFEHGGHDTGWRVGAWVIFAVASVTDRVDGDLARRRQIVTEFGKLADPIADKALVGAALVSLSALHELSWWVTAIVLGREVAVTGLRLWVIRHGVIPASRGGKLKTLLQAVAIGLYVLPLSGWLHVAAAVIMAAAVVVALVTGVDYVARAVRLRRASLARVRDA